ncbi:MAG: hypothetical protein OEM59_04655 [Rhodospirillales bacterium]|nr:hypothetical protein [Rhodospirillales bacterium]
MQRPGLIGERAIGLFLVAFLALNPPILSIFSTEGFFFGVPLLYFYLFGVWGGIILLIGVHSLAAKARHQSPTGRDRGQGG